jgi:hypothetical protein
VPTPFEAEDSGSSAEAPRGPRGGRAKLLLAVLIPLALAAGVVGGYLLYERTDFGRSGVATEVPQDRLTAEGPGEAAAPTAEQTPEAPADIEVAAEPAVEEESEAVVIARIRELLAAGDSGSLAEAESLLERLGPGPQRSGLEAAVRERADQLRRRALP